MGRAYQGRFKSLAGTEDEHLLRVLRYVERNPRRGWSSWPNRAFYGG